jgi:hypothetical protein
MTGSVGDKAIVGSAAIASEDSNTVYTLADVLEREFSELHQEVTDETLAQDRTGATQANQQQPLEDPSLSPADHQTRDQAIEYTEIGKIPSREPDIEAKLRKLWESVHALRGDGRTALCLSGGGVRSAAFNLGVLQGLARLELLSQFHYLSTVSGGGYIGSWLVAWRHRCQKGILDVTRGLSWPDPIGDAAVPRRVPHAISNLRRGTNYLTPVKGILSADAWATIVVVGRNLILNHLVIVPLIAALLVIVKLLGATAHTELFFSDWEKFAKYLIETLPLQHWTTEQYLGSLLLAGSLVVLGWIMFSIARPSWDVRRPAPPISTVPSTTTLHRESLDRENLQIWAPRLGIAFVLSGAFMFALETANDIPKGSSWDWKHLAAFPIAGAVGAILAFVLALAVAAVKRALGKSPKTARWAARFLGYVPDVPPGPVTVLTAGAPAVLLLALAAVAGGAAGGLVLGGGEQLATHLRNEPTSTALVLSIAPLWFVISYNIGDAVFLGLTVRRPSPKGRQHWSDQWGDEEREWVARTGGYLMVIAVGFSILCLLTFFGPHLIKLVADFATVAIPIILILSALASIGLAASPLSTHLGTAPKETRLPVRTILLVATPIFAGLLTAILSTAIDAALFKESLLTLLSTEGDSGPWFDPRKTSGQGWLLGLAVLLAFFSYIAAHFVNINRFSLYDVYRMRLTREFLGASNEKRRPDFWTGFDETDDIPLTDLWPPHDKERRLYPVINVTLNMAATKRLEWQERKAVSFVLTPLYCGSGATPDLGFRDTSDYAAGIRLGWAMGVSGAAVSPNAGYSTMPGLALLMTLFNLRLGAWSGNPGKAGEKSYRLRGPANALRPLLSEALVRTNDRAKYVYLSDGGHFDNLGVYEMLRRRCRFIVISDATWDPGYAYADLGSVVRKAAIDFGIRIRFEHLDMAQRNEKTAVKGAYSAFAVIEYPEADSRGRRRRGYLLFIKSFYRGLEEPADVRAYALENPAFPHDKTLDQFFGEAQFESYRALGSFAVMELGRKAGFAATSKAQKPACLTQFFKGARKGLARSRAAREDRSAQPIGNSKGRLPPGRPYQFKTSV